MPVGRNLYALYCEIAPGAPAPPDEPGHGFWQRLVARFRAVLAAVEHEERQRQKDPAAQPADSRRLMARLKRRALRWLAARIAEQRLLWHLRQVDRATAIFPDDLDAASSLARLRTILARDRNRHRLWLIANVAFFVTSGLLMPVPGPNLVAYYFAFRAVGHFLSLRGAQRGLNAIEWETRPSAALTALRQAATLEPAAREQHVREIATRLGLHDLPRFYLRTAVSGA